MRRTWKFCHIRSADELRWLDSYRRSCTATWRNYTIVLGNQGGLETDMPWRELRKWFSFAGVPLPEIGSSSDPSWIIYDDTPSETKRWPAGPLLTWEGVESFIGE